ncbi:hypothetical protein [Streptomyces sp. NPDC054958]
MMPSGSRLVASTRSRGQAVDRRGRAAVHPEPVLAQAEGGQQGLRQPGPVAQRGRLHEAHLVRCAPAAPAAPAAPTARGTPGAHETCRLDRQPGLADTSGPGQGDQPGHPQHLGDLGRIRR